MLLSRTTLHCLYAGGASATVFSHAARARLSRRSIIAASRSKLRDSVEGLRLPFPLTLPFALLAHRWRGRADGEVAGAAALRAAKH